MQHEATPLVSVIIPTHNSAAFIGQALQGVLAQTYRGYEVIVIDDGSTDDTQEVLRQFGSQIRYLYQDNQGPAAARNAGIRLAQGEFVCLLDADDTWAPNKLALQTRFMAGHGDVGLLFGDAEEGDETTIQKRSILATMRFGAEIQSQTPLQEPFRKLVVENFIPTSTVMIRKSCFVTSGLFDEDLPNAEDRDMWLRLSAHFAISCLPQVLAKKRTHSANISARTEIALRSRIKVWTKARRGFPALAPAEAYYEMLAGSHQELGYLALARAEGRTARQHGIESLGNALKYPMATHATFPFLWFLAIGLVPLSFVPWPLVRYFWQARNFLLGRNASQTAGVTQNSTAVSTKQVKGVVQ